MAKQNAGNPVGKQFVNLSLTGGVNKKADAHLLTNGELLTADNVVFSAVDRQITKRYGFQAITPFGAPFQGGPFKALGCRDNAEPLVLGASTLNRYNAAQNLSTSIPLQTQARITKQSMTASTGKSYYAWPPTHASCASDNQKYLLCVWEEPNTTGALMFYAVQDLATGNYIISPRQLDNFYAYSQSGSTFTTAYSPKAHYSNGAFYVSVLSISQTSTPTPSYTATVWMGQYPLTNLSGGIIPTYNSFVLQTGGTLSYTNCPQNLLSYDMHISNGKWAIANTGNPNDQRASIRYGLIGTSTSSDNVTSLYFNQTGQNFMALSPPILGGTAAYAGIRVSVRCDGPPDTPYAMATPSDFCTVKANSQVIQTQLSVQNGLNTYSSYFYPLEPVSLLWVGSTLYVAYTSYNTTRAQVSVIKANTNAQIVAQCGGAGPLQSYYTQILSNLFVQPSGKVALWIGQGANNNDVIYNSAFCIEYSFDSTVYNRPVARTLYLTNQHIGLGDRMTPCEVVQVPGTSKYVTLLTEATEKAGGNQANWRSYGTLNRVTLEFSPKRQVQVLSLPTGGNLICGAYPLYYDGATVTEAGFSAAPDYATMPAALDYGYQPGPVIVSAQTSYGLAGGTNLVTLSGFMEYYYVVCLCRRDSYGNVYRSSPSETFTAVCPNPYNNVFFNALFYNSGGLTNDVASNVTVEFYRSTQGTPGTYYYLGQVPLATGFNDSQPDGSTAPSLNNSITKNRTVYTNAGELNNDPPPPIHHAVASESRVYIIPADNRNVVWYSKQFSPGRTVEFSAALTLSEGLNSGQFEALAVLDANLIVFKKDQILFTYGNGPDNTGSNGNFNPFQKIASDVGCIDPGSVAQIPDGIVFRSSRGIELLTRALQVVYIGSNVEPLVQQMGTISSVVCMPGFTELRFVPSTPGQPVLCYDYGAKRWSTFSNMAAVQAINMMGNYWHISADGALVNAETMGTYTDNGSPIVMTLETPEIPVGVAGAQGWGRAYRMALLGDFMGAATPTDYALTVSFAYDHSTTYTDAISFSTAMGLVSGDTVYQFRASRLPRQVMQTLRLKIQDTGVAGQACGISDLALEVGSKNGLAKLATAKTIGGV